MGGTQSDESDTQSSSGMRQATDVLIDTSHLSDAKRELMIINKRGAFQWLPVWHDPYRGPINDLEVGSW